MNNVNRKVLANDEVEIFRLQPLQPLQPLKNTKDLTFSMNGHITHFNVKFRKSREGVISCLKRINIENEEMLKLKNRKCEIKKELNELCVYIKDVGRYNQKLEADIKKEIELLKIIDTNVAIIKRNKNQMLKLQEIAKEEMSFMTSTIEKMKDRKNESLSKYFKVIGDEHKLKNESKNVQQEKTHLQTYLKDFQQNHKDLKQQMQDLVDIMK